MDHLCIFKRYFTNYLKLEPCTVKKLNQKHCCDFVITKNDFCGVCGNKVQLMTSKIREAMRVRDPHH